MALSARDPTDRVEQLIILTERLTTLIAVQAQAFEEQRPRDAAAQLEETSKLANVYRHESARVRADPNLISSAPAELRTRLIRATEAFDAVLARQGRALNAARKVSEGLVRAIADEVANQREKSAAYGPGGAITKARRDAGKAITLNKRA